MAQTTERYYKELQAFLLPLTDKVVSQSTTKDYNRLVEELISAFGDEEDVSKYLVNEKAGVPTDEIMRKGLSLLTVVNESEELDRDATEFFKKRQSKEAQLNLNQHILQQTDVRISIVSEITDRLSSYEESHKLDSNEKSFVSQLKDKVKGVTSVIQLLSMILSLATSCGLTQAQVHKIFS